MIKLSNILEAGYIMSMEGMFDQNDLVQGLRDYQRKIYDELKSKDEAGTPFHSIVALPTGGGKTRLAVVYAMNRMLANGKKILWTAHRQELLNQAYAEFKEMFTESGKEWFVRNSILLYTGKRGQGFADLTPEHQLVFATLQGLRRNDSWKEKMGEQVFIVVDEAHHLVLSRGKDGEETGYQTILKEYAEGKSCIGLSATPIRRLQSEQNSLYEFFDSPLKYRVDMKYLIREGYLFNPEIENAITRRQELGIQEDMPATEIWGELSHNDLYNRFIYQRYREHEKEYGKTLVFAINKRHVDELYKLFRETYEERVFRVYSRMQGNREEEIKRFRSSEKGIMINVEIMTEGVDIRTIKTVFLTRPSESTTLVTQCVGRALRPLSNEDKRQNPNVEKDKAYVVNFAVAGLGGKILLTMPRMVMNLEQIMWLMDEDDDIDMSEELETALRKIMTTAKDAKAEHVDMCFSDICIAGWYQWEIGEGEKKDYEHLIVSEKERQAIEAYREGKKHLPRRFYFTQQPAHMVRESLDIGVENGTLSYYPIADEEAQDEYVWMDGKLKELYRRKKEENLPWVKMFPLIQELYELSNQKEELKSMMATTDCSEYPVFERLVMQEIVRLRWEESKNE